MFTIQTQSWEALLWKVALDYDDKLLEAEEMDHPAIKDLMKQIREFMAPMMMSEGPAVMRRQQSRPMGFLSIDTPEFYSRFPGVSFKLSKFVDPNSNDGQSSNMDQGSTDAGRRYQQVPHSYAHKWHEADMVLQQSGRSLAIASQSVENITGAINVILDPTTSTNLNRTQETRDWRRHEGREMDETILVTLQEQMENLQSFDDTISTQQPMLELIQKAIDTYLQWFKAHVHDEDLVCTAEMMVRLRQLMRCQSQRRFEEVRVMLNISFCQAAACDHQ